MYVLLFMTLACLLLLLSQSELISKSLCMSESTEYYILSIHQLIRTAAHNSNVLELTQGTLLVAR